MKIVTLTTDFGERDYSVGATKGAIYTSLPDACIVDISHLIAPFDILQAAYVLRNAYSHFPKGSVHVIGVDSEETPERKHLIMFLNGHYFIGTDNGIFHLLSESEKNVEIYEISSTENFSIFPVLDFFPKIIAKVHNGISLEEIGQRTDKYLKINYLKPETSANDSTIRGQVIYIDHYGNAVSNINRSLFYEVGQNRSFEVIFNMYRFKKIHNSYSDIVNFNIPIENRSFEGNSLILFNSVDYLQCSIYKSDLQTVGGASSLLGINISDMVSVRFTDKNY